MTRVPPSLPPHSVSFGIYPLERLILPSHLDGSTLPRGSLLFPFRINARNDLEAIEVWLSEVAKTESSFSSYRLEAERCLLWATVERGKPLSALNSKEVYDYTQFLLDPQPYERWVCAGAPKRTEASWRPFRGPLSTNSRTRALSIISGLFKWLEYAGYISENPWNGPEGRELRNAKRDDAPALISNRSANVCSAVEWMYVRRALEQMESQHDSLPARIKAVLYLAYFADLKPGEIGALRTSSISMLSSGPIPVWKLEVEGRPPKMREVALLPPVQQAIERDLAERGTILCTERLLDDSPLIESSRGESHCTRTDARIGTTWSIKQIFSNAAALARSENDRLAASRLAGASIHWLKHAFEVHSSPIKRSRDWSWFLLGACWLAPPAFRSYLTRPPLSVATTLEAFEELRCMWH